MKQRAQRLLARLRAAMPGRRRPPTTTREGLQQEQAAVVRGATAPRA